MPMMNTTNTLFIKSTGNPSQPITPNVHNSPNASGNSVSFLTGLCLLNSHTGLHQTDCISFTVHMRTLSTEQIERYLLAEQPYDCAGSFKAEGLGVSLFQRTEGDDATSLVGLPLIRLVSMLLAEGVDIP